MSSPSTPFPWKGGCPKGRGLAEGEIERSQPPALRATSFQRKEGKVVKAIYCRTMTAAFSTPVPRIQFFQRSPL